MTTGIRQIEFLARAIVNRLGWNAAVAQDGQRVTL